MSNVGVAYGGGRQEAHTPSAALRKPMAADLRTVLEISSRTIGLYPVDKLVVDEAKNKLMNEGFKGDAQGEALRIDAFEYLHMEMKMRTCE